MECLGMGGSSTFQLSQKEAVRDVVPSVDNPQLYPLFGIRISWSGNSGPIDDNCLLP